MPLAAADVYCSSVHLPHVRREDFRHHWLHSSVLGLLRELGRVKVGICQSCCLSGAPDVSLPTCNKPTHLTLVQHFACACKLMTL